MLDGTPREQPATTLLALPHAHLAASFDVFMALVTEAQALAARETRACGRQRAALQALSTPMQHMSKSSPSTLQRHTARRPGWTRLTLPRARPCPCCTCCGRATWRQRKRLTQTRAALRPKTRRGCVARARRGLLPCWPRAGEILSCSYFADVLKSQSSE